jgi:adenylate cyclase
MKRKIAAIFAADIAGYSRLVAEDEEETLRRLASYRAVTDDFIVKAGGRIFNTAGDAVLAEFPSAVEAVRCAIDIQESLRTRNMAYPPSRQMAFRIGITIGDVVERDGDLLGDGVNIAARLEGIAEVGGICVSRAVHEQVANKLSVVFADIGAQEVKNIPTPVHAYMVAMRREDGTYATPQLKKVVKPAAASAWMWPLAATVICLVAIGVGGFLYFTKLELSPGASRETAPVEKMAAAALPEPVPAAAATPTPAPAAAATPASASTPSPLPTAVAMNAAPPAPPPAPAASPSPAVAAPSALSGEKFAPENVPFIGPRVRGNLASEYVGGADYKAFALNAVGIPGFVVGQPNEEAARNAALDLCQKRADNNHSPQRCALYAVGDTVVYARGRPPMPPQPWIRHDPAIDRPFAAKDVPLVRDAGRARIESAYATDRRPRALAVGPNGQFFNLPGDSVEEAARRSLESCGAVTGVPCMIVAADDVFVVPVPTTMKATGFFRAANDPSIVADARAEVSRKLDASSGWNAVAVGAAGRPGVGLKAVNEQNAISGALGDCAAHDRDCRVIAIGPFHVEPN